MKLIKFAQTVCGPCNVLTMMMNQMGAEADEVRMLDSEELLEKAQKDFGVMSTPTLLLLDDEGNEVARAVGVHPPTVAGVLTQAGKL